MHFHIRGLLEHYTYENDVLKKNITICLTKINKSKVIFYELYIENIIKLEKKQICSITHVPKNMNCLITLDKNNLMNCSNIYFSIIDNKIIYDETKFKTTKRGFSKPPVWLFSDQVNLEFENINIKYSDFVSDLDHCIIQVLCSKTCDMPKKWIFIGPSGIGKSFVGSKIKNLRVFETDSLNNLNINASNYDVFIVGNKKHKFISRKNLLELIKNMCQDYYICEFKKL